MCFIVKSNHCSFCRRWSGVAVNTLLSHCMKKNKQEMIFASSKDTDQPVHPRMLIRVATVCIKKARVLSYPISTKQRLWSDWADRSFCLFCRFVGHFIFLYVKKNLSQCLLWQELETSLIKYPSSMSPSTTKPTCSIGICLADLYSQSYVKDVWVLSYPYSARRSLIRFADLSLYSVHV